MSIASPFSYISVTPSSGKVGTFNNYTFTLTLSVDTEANSVIQVSVPSQIGISENLSCKGLLSLSSQNLRCERWNEKTIKVYIWGKNSSAGFT